MCCANNDILNCISYFLKSYSTVDSNSFWNSIMVPWTSYTFLNRRESGTTAIHWQPHNPQPVSPMVQSKRVIVTGVLLIVVAFGNYYSIYFPQYILDFIKIRVLPWESVHLHRTIIHKTIGTKGTLPRNTRHLDSGWFTSCLYSNPQALPLCELFLHQCEGRLPS